VKRKRLTKAARAAMLEAQGGCCVVFGCTETTGLIEEHSTVFAWTGEQADQLMCPMHHKLKTRSDIKRIAKVRRLRKGPKKGKRPIRSRGFDKTKRKRMNGTVEVKR